MIVITGAAGFIGSVICRSVNQAGRRDLILVDDLGSGESWKNLVGKEYLQYINKADFLSQVRARKLPSSIEAIIHMGACSATTERNAEYVMQNNYCYTQVLAEYAIERNIRFIYASSGATYGDGAHGYSDSHQELHKLEPRNVYGYSKHAFDMWALQSKVLDKIVGLKFFNVFGPNEYHKGPMSSVVLKAYQQIKDSGRVKLFRSNSPQFGDGEQKRDFVYVRDCADVVLWLLHNPAVNGIFNLGSGKAASWNQLTRAVFTAMKRPESIEYVPMPEELAAHYQNFTEASMGKLLAAGYKKPFHSLENGVLDYVGGFLSQGLKTL